MRRGSLFLGRRIEQAIGNLAAVYIRSHSKNPEQVNALNFMPHEVQGELSLFENLEKIASE
ncbi:hypothetical protein [Acinetobacter baumannii]|uniref:hypothetical protein n=1 Tax=Acinetobacter baumannii TaxID=470 RepID=UPI000DECCBC2|nr:hypothetical protein [Acinetobacter baumannii]EHU1961538.1 hypothetical protein [Acinetobacter baumannii]MBF8382854.1 hypothetical protein [Acinetobacter baumannii]MBJ3830287.1 hypothetical protein [Acinetobacter baumannii]MBP3075784.1 hypothetical protein [Acinetobacter baumannii]MBP5082486.1 hypothetical protein [Acinetobacter baumannii]